MSYKTERPIVQSIREVVKGFVQQEPATMNDPQTILEWETRLVEQIDFFAEILKRNFGDPMISAKLPVDTRDIFRSTVPDVVRDTMYQAVVNDKHASVVLSADKNGTAAGIQLVILDQLGRPKNQVSLCHVQKGHVGIYATSVEATTWIDANLNQGTPLQQQAHHLEASELFLQFVGHQLIRALTQ